MEVDQSKLIKVRDLSFRPLISEEAIQQRVKEIANEIETSYAGRQPLFIAILNGAFMFASDMFKQFDLDCEIEFVQVQSYSGLNSTGSVEILSRIKSEIGGKDIVIIEDIVDTGLTMTRFVDFLKKHNPKSIAIASLLVKPDKMEFPVTVDYVGFEIPELFVVGYGLDYDGFGRQINSIYQIAQ